MSDFFYTLVKDAIEMSQNGDSTLMESYYAVPLEKMKQWCCEQLDEYVTLEYLQGAIIRDVDLYELWRFIQDNCRPDEDEEEETSSESSEASCAHA